MNPNPLFFAEVKGRTVGLKDCTSSICSMLPSCPPEMLPQPILTPTSAIILNTSAPSCITGRIPNGLEDKCMLKSMSFLSIFPFKNNSERFHRKLLYLSGSTSGHSESRE